MTTTTHTTTTTIQIQMGTRDKLKKLKAHPRESFDSVVERLVESKIDDKPLSETTLKNIEKSLEDIKAGRVISHEDLKKKLNL